MAELRVVSTSKEEIKNSGNSDSSLDVARLAYDYITHINSQVNEKCTSGFINGYEKIEFNFKEKGRQLNGLEEEVYNLSTSVLRTVLQDNLESRKEKRNVKYSNDPHIQVRDWNFQ